jgi:hypothetical protein
LHDIPLTVNYFDLSLRGDVRQVVEIIGLSGFCERHSRLDA